MDSSAGAATLSGQLGLRPPSSSEISADDAAEKLLIQPASSPLGFLQATALFFKARRSLWPRRLPKRDIRVFLRHAPAGESPRAQKSVFIRRGCDMVSIDTAMSRTGSARHSANGMTDPTA